MNNPRVGDNQTLESVTWADTREFEISWGKWRVPRDALALSRRYLVSSESFDEVFRKKKEKKERRKDGSPV